MLKLPFFGCSALSALVLYGANSVVLVTLHGAVCQGPAFCSLTFPLGSSPAPEELNSIALSNGKYVHSQCSI